MHIVPLYIEARNIVNLKPEACYKKRKEDSKGTRQHEKRKDTKENNSRGQQNNQPVNP